MVVAEKCKDCDAMLKSFSSLITPCYCLIKRFVINGLVVPLRLDEFVAMGRTFGFPNAHTTGVPRKNVSKTCTPVMRKSAPAQLEPLRSRKFCHLQALASKVSVS